MVVPLKLTQFYGHSVPRPRIYAAVKFSEHRVDPPLSVNDALLSWASDAHWSMGGLSFKRMRAQGKIEGSVRRLRAFLEEDEDVPDASEKVSAAGTKLAENAGKVKPTSVKVAGKPLERKRQRSEEESVEATPVRKLRKRETLREYTDEDSPIYVPATEEKLQKKLGAESAEVVSNNMRKKGLRLPSKAEAIETETPSSVAAKGERQRKKLYSSSGKTVRGSKSPAAHRNLAMGSSPASEGGRLTRSGIKKATHEDASVSPLQPSKGRPRVRKILVRASDEDSSESDDGLEAFLMEKGRTVRRSSRIVKEQANSSQNASDSESE